MKIQIPDLWILKQKKLGFCYILLQFVLLQSFGILSLFWVFGFFLSLGDYKRVKFITPCLAQTYKILLFYIY